MIDRSKKKNRLGFFLQGCFLIGGILLSFYGTPSNGQINPGPGSPSPAPVEDIRDIMIERPPGSPLPWIIGVLVFVILIVSGCIFLRKLANRHQVITGPPPDYVARRRLAEIRNHVDDIPPNKASLETSEAVKDFLTARYHDPIRYETAEEYLTRISQTQSGGEAAKLSRALTEDVRSFMAISQELKFAQIREARQRIPDLIKQAETIVELAMQQVH